MTKERIIVYFQQDKAVAEDSDAARELNNQSNFGALTGDNKLQLSFLEAFYLLEKNRVTIVNALGREMSRKTILRKVTKLEPKFWVRYCVFKNIRDRGYIIKTALKFGADFRIYDRGVKPGEDHARWIVYPVHEGEQLTWHEFAAKNRVAHSTRKRLLIGVVDDEGDVSYWEVRWIRP